MSDGGGDNAEEARPTSTEKRGKTRPQGLVGTRVFKALRPRWARPTSRVNAPVSPPGLEENIRDGSFAPLSTFNPWRASRIFINLSSTALPDTTG